jgi:hypothetical protein
VQFVSHKLHGTQYTPQLETLFTNIAGHSGASAEKLSVPHLKMVQMKCLSQNGLLLKVYFF